MMFELFPRPTNGEDGKPLLYARPVAPYKRTMKDVERYCSYRGVNSGLVAIAFDTFIEACSEWLAEGYRVETPLGVFSPKITLKGDFTDPKKVKGKNIKLTGIELATSKRFFREVARKQKGFYKKEGIVDSTQPLDDEYLAQALRQALKPGFTTIQLFMAVTGLKYHAAQQYLNTLCSGNMPLLRRQKIGNSYHYFEANKQEQEP